MQFITLLAQCQLYYIALPAVKMCDKVAELAQKFKLAGNTKRYDKMSGCSIYIVATHHKPVYLQHMVKR